MKLNEMKQNWHLSISWNGITGLSTCYSTAYRCRLMCSSVFTTLEVAAEWHELMTPWCFVQPSAARDSQQLDLCCSMTHSHHQPH